MIRKARSSTYTSFELGEPMYLRRVVEHKMSVVDVFEIRLICRAFENRAIVGKPISLFHVIRIIIEP